MPNIFSATLVYFDWYISLQIGFIKDDFPQTFFYLSFFYVFLEDFIPEAPF